ncbi:MAG: efflux RND transporter periplasmic adaptor subunit [Pirellulales bacterium]
MRNRFAQVVLPLFALGLLAFGLHHAFHSDRAFAIPKTTPPATPARNPFGKTIAGYGLVEARSQNVAVGSPLAGVVLEVFVPAEQVGAQVKSGAPLFRVDDRHLRAQRDFQAANLRVAETEVMRLEARPRSEELPPSAAKVKAAEANVKLWRDQSERSQRLAAARVVTEEQNVERQLRLEAAEQELAQAKAEDDLLRAGTWTHDLEVARANVELAKAQLHQVEIELDRTIVRAPVDGAVLQVNVRAGEYVAAGPQTPLVVLGDTHVLHVRVDIDEHDVPRFRPGSPAKAYLRGDGQRELSLRFVRVEPYVIPKKWLTGDNTERVDTRILQVIYAVEKTDQTLYVGQMLDVYIALDEASPAESAAPRTP